MTNGIRKEALSYCFVENPEMAEVVEGAAHYINEQAGVDAHQLLVVLGSGFAGVADCFSEINARFNLADLPGVPAPSAEGHGHELISVSVSNRCGKPVSVLLATGRSHIYEGLTPTQVCALVRIAAMTGIQQALLTNAGGCLQDWKMGDLMVVEDHLNFLNQSPFEGPVFVDIARVWDKGLQLLLRNLAERSGVYAALSGPEFQTLAESRYLRNNGVDQVGMSTVLEAISLHQLGVKVAGLSLVSDLSFSDTPCTHEEVLAAANTAIPKIAKAIQILVDNIQI